jgi:hypothetical protein
MEHRYTSASRLVVVSIVVQALESARSPVFLVKHYGFGGIVLWIFGSSAIWRMEKQVLESDGEEVAMDFKRSIQNESNMIAVAVKSPLLHLSSCELQPLN